MLLNKVLLWWESQFFYFILCFTIVWYTYLNHGWCPNRCVVHVDASHHTCIHDGVRGDECGWISRSGHHYGSLPQLFARCKPLRGTWVYRSSFHIIVHHNVCLGRRQSISRKLTHPFSLFSLQFWRLATSFLYMGQLGLPFVLKMYFAYVSILREAITWIMTHIHEIAFLDLCPSFVLAQH